MNPIIDTYNTIENVAEGLYKSKGSKFIALAYPITSENEVKPIIDTLKKQHHNARHHCYAWRLGVDNKRYRANDDGEPSGTAGQPILNQLKSKQLTNILVVVVRYFGGTLLGVSGLITAYKEATIDALEQASVIEKIIEKEIKINFEYPLMNTVMKVVKDEKLTVVNTKYESNCELIVSVRSSHFEHVFLKLKKIHEIETSTC